LLHIFIVKKVKEGEELARGYYHRSFVILQPWDSKVNIKAEKPPAGYCKIEVRNDKCRMYFHVQDLKSHGVQQEGYDVFLVSAQEGISPQKIASIYVDQRGRGECAVEINVNDVGGSGYSLDQFHGLAVVRDDHGDISYPLVGYANKRVELDWGGRIKRDIGRYYNKAAKAVTESRKEASAARPLEERKEEGAQREPLFTMDSKKQKTIQDIITALGPLLQSRMQESRVEQEKMQAQQAQEVEKEQDGDREKAEGQKAMVQGEKMAEKADMTSDETYSPSKSPQKIVEEQDEEVMAASTDAAPEAQMEDASQAGKDGQGLKARETVTGEMVSAEGQAQEQEGGVEGEPVEGESKIQQQAADLSGKQTYWEKTREYYTRLFETHRRVYPFIVEMEEVQWVEVPYEDDYGQYSYIASRNAGNGYHYGHYIVGLVKENGEVRYVAYGIPGPYGTMPPAFMQGFYRWAPSRYGYGMGYWLLYVDAHTGEIAYPY